MRYKSLEIMSSRVECQYRKVVTYLFTAVDRVVNKTVAYNKIPLIMTVSSGTLTFLSRL